MLITSNWKSSYENRMTSIILESKPKQKTSSQIIIQEASYLMLKSLRRSGSLLKLSLLNSKNNTKKPTKKLNFSVVKEISNSSPISKTNSNSNKNLKNYSNSKINSPNSPNLSTLNKSQKMIIKTKIKNKVIKWFLKMEKKTLNKKILTSKEKSKNGSYLKDMLLKKVKLCLIPSSSLIKLY